MILLFSPSHLAGPIGPDLADTALALLMPHATSSKRRKEVSVNHKERD